MNSKVEKLYKKISNDKKKVVFFGLSYCEFCKKTIELLQKKKITYKYYQIDNYYNIFFNVLTEVSKLYPNIGINLNHKTVPIIFVKKKFIGGFTNLEKKINN
jgi:glutaredoxin